MAHGLLSCQILDTGSCTHLERLISQRGRLRSVRLRVIVALLEHPTEGQILVDTGYAPRVPAVSPLLYRALLSFDAPPEQTARAQIAGPVRHVILTHLHPDHIGGLLDFPEASLHLHRDCQPLLRRAAFFDGLFPALLPEDLEERARWHQDFHGVPLPVVDILGDGTLLGVDLPGHSPGHMGVLARLAHGRRLLLAGDAAWLAKGAQLELPSRLAGFIEHDRRAMVQTLARIQRARDQDPDLQVLTSHDPTGPLGLL